MQQTGQPFAVLSSDGLGPLPPPNYPAERDYTDAWTADQMRAYSAQMVAAERERWAAAFSSASECIAQDDAPLHRGYKLALSDMAAKMRA